jgi:hypothetical protein
MLRDIINKMSRTSKSVKPATSKLTISMPATSRDCDVMFTRIASEIAKATTQLSDGQAKKASITELLSSLQKQLDETEKQNLIIGSEIKQQEENRKALDVWYRELKQKQQIVDSSIHCHEYLSKWIYETEDGAEAGSEAGGEDVGAEGAGSEAGGEDAGAEGAGSDAGAEGAGSEDVNRVVKRYIPHDAFKFMKINNGVITSIDNLTSDEINKLALYVRACELLNERRDVLTTLRHSAHNYDRAALIDSSSEGLNRFYDMEYNEYDEDYYPELCRDSIELLSYLEYNSTYGELFESQSEHQSTKYFGVLSGCNRRAYSSECCYKAYAWKLHELKYFTFDTLEMRQMLNYDLL